MTIDERLRRLIARRNVSQSEVATLAGMSRQQLGEILKGGRPHTTVATVERIVGAIGATMTELYEEDTP